MTFYLVLSRLRSFSHRFTLKTRRRKLIEINKSVVFQGVIKVIFKKRNLCVGFFC